MDSKSQAFIEVRNLDLSYDDYAVLRDLNFSVNKGDIFIVMGESGCGKSTLLKALIGLKPPEKGEVWLQRLAILLKRFPAASRTSV